MEHEVTVAPHPLAKSRPGQPSQGDHGPGNHDRPDAGPVFVEKRGHPTGSGLLRRRLATARRLGE
jgi:hypothetical protein